MGKAMRRLPMRMLSVARSDITRHILFTNEFWTEHAQELPIARGKGGGIEC